MKFKRLFCMFLTLMLLICQISAINAIEKNIDVNASSYALMEQSTGKIICEKNSHEVRFAASVMKIMVLLMAASALDLGKISEKDVVTISDKAAETKGANVWLKAGETINVGDLIKSIAIVSANDACVALGEHIAGSEGKFISMMNEKAKQLEMNDTIFKDCIGSDEDGNVTSAYDVAVMSRELMEHKCILPYISTWIDHIRDGQTQIVNTNKLIKTYQGSMGIKTGTSEKAGSCISACAERENLMLIAVVLGGENSKDRFSNVSNLLDYGFSGFTVVSPKIPEELPKTIKINGGMAGEVNIIPRIEDEFLIPKGKEKDVLCEINIKEDIDAPVNKGVLVGTIKYTLGDEILSECEVFTESNVEKISFQLILHELFISFVKM